MSKRRATKQLQLVLPPVIRRLWRSIISSNKNHIFRASQLRRVWSKTLEHSSTFTAEHHAVWFGLQILEVCYGQAAREPGQKIKYSKQAVPGRTANEITEICI